MNKITKTFAVSLMMIGFSSVSVAAGSLALAKDPNNFGFVAIDNSPTAMVLTTETGGGFAIVRSEGIQSESGLVMEIEPTRGTKCFRVYKVDGMEQVLEIPCDSIKVVTTDD